MHCPLLSFVLGLYYTPYTKEKARARIETRRLQCVSMCHPFYSAVAGGDKGRVVVVVASSVVGIGSALSLPDRRSLLVWCYLCSLLPPAFCLLSSICRLVFAVCTYRPVPHF